MKLLGQSQCRSLWICLGWLIAAASARSASFQTNSAAAFNQLISLDPNSDNNLVQLARIADLFNDAKSATKAAKAEKKLARNSEELKNLPTSELQKLFIEDTVKHDNRIASAIGRLASEALHPGTTAERAACISGIVEIQAATRNERRSPVPERLGVFNTWVFFFKNMSGKIGHGTTLAVNLSQPVPSKSDGGRIDPVPSTFWTRPQSISNEDLYVGFGRERLPQLADLMFEYNAPKTSAGTHGGFDVEWQGQRLKIKFGEENSEPLTARIFCALGYHVDPTDYASRIKVRYDRRMLREFHLRKPINMRITPFGIPVGTIHLQTHFDPFTFIATAVFKDGHEISGAALKQQLFLNPNIPHPEDSPENFRPEVEASLDYLVMVAANVQPRDGPTQSLGSWDFGQLGHENLRELRGAGLLAAWLSWFDSRPENTKLRVFREKDDVQIEHFFTDLGGGTGSAVGWFSPRGENPNQFTWTFTKPEILRGAGHMTTPFRITNFKPVVPTPAFAAMTLDDARWMARLISQLTENQLRAALIASGYDNASARIYLEKLISRRDRMIVDLGLQDEIPLLRPKGQNHEFSYSPGSDGPFETTLANGSRVSARTSTNVISHGKLVAAQASTLDAVAGIVR